MIIIIRTGTTRQAWWRCSCCGRGGRSSRSSTGGTTLSSESTSKSSSYHNHYLRDGPHSQVRLRQNHHNHIQNHYHHHYFHELILIAIITLIRIKILYQVAATFAKHALSAGLTSHNLTAHLVWRWVWTDHNWTLIFKVESWTWSKSQNNLTLIFNQNPRWNAASRSLTRTRRWSWWTSGAAPSPPSCPSSGRSSPSIVSLFKGFDEADVPRHHSLSS